MDDLDFANFGNDNLDKPIPFDDDLDKPIPLDDNPGGKTGVSHSPLDLGGTAPAKIPKVEFAAQAAEPAAKKPAAETVSAERITGIKTFFTKLHPGALEFLDEQITNWLRKNPGITVKRTNTVTGIIQGKKSEPNIVVSIWY